MKMNDKNQDQVVSKLLTLISRAVLLCLAHVEQHF